MTVILDTSFLFALTDNGDRNHDRFSTLPFKESAIASTYSQMDEAVRSRRLWLLGVRSTCPV